MVTWVEAIPSVTLQFARDRTLAEILATLPDRSSVQFASTPVQIDWGRVIVPTLLAALPLGPVGGAALTLVSELCKQLLPARDETRAIPRRLVS